MVWYQKFEYAIAHWFQKAAEHVFGCVLCAPGCFSLFRASALMDDNVMQKYTKTASEPRHFVQYDQGEDRWLSTLLLKQVGVFRLLKNFIMTFLLLYVVFMIQLYESIFHILLKTWSGQKSRGEIE